MSVEQKIENLSATKLRLTDFPLTRSARQARKEQLNAPEPTELHVVFVFGIRQLGETAKTSIDQIRLLMFELKTLRV